MDGVPADCSQPAGSFLRTDGEPTHVQLLQAGEAPMDLSAQEEFGEGADVPAEDDAAAEMSNLIVKDQVMSEEPETPIFTTVNRAALARARASRASRASRVSSVSAAGPRLLEDQDD